MTTDRWQRTHELFDAALALPEAERRAFLAQACGEDADLLAEVESLLEHDTAAGEDFLSPPVGGVPLDPSALELSPPVRGTARTEVRGSPSEPPALELAPPDDGTARAEARGSPPEPSASLPEPSASAGALPEPSPSGGALPDPLIGRRVGRYHVKSLLAAGGMARVYEAVQEQPHRVVALKVMKRGVASRSALRRFEFESQVLGRLRHPAVAAVHEAGTHRDGAEVVPYFAMEYVPGARPITEYATGWGLDIRERLELFAAVCDAVDHGHTKGIIHRDIKPTNILVNSAGEPKVIDFGVARTTDSDLAATTQQTFVGQLVGTVQYMSPEQCGGDPHDIDTRSDVYSLGVVLYELLTGRPPYDASTTTLYQAIRVVREQEPEPPSAINRRLRGDLETIVLKALAKERAKRYQSAAALGADIRRYLRGDPIEARPPTAWTRTVRWVGRHPVAATTATCAAFVMSSVGATWMSVWVINYRPCWIELSPDGRLAWLVAYNGNRISHWATDSPQGFRFARFMDQRAGNGPRKLVVLGYPRFDQSAHAGRLCAFDAGGVEDQAPVWESSIVDADLLEVHRPRRFSPAEFAIGRAMTADIFSDAPGDENIIAVFDHAPKSPRLLRIYDLRGQVLWSLWYDGAIHSLYWMSNAELLICAGSDARTHCDAFGRRLSSDEDPLVVFAVRPRLGWTAKVDYLSVKAAEEEARPVWAFRVHPPEVGYHLRRELPLNLGLVPTNHDLGQAVSVAVEFDLPGRPTCGWYVDGNGNVVGQSPNDAYEQWQLRRDKPAWLPDPRDIKLVPHDLGVTKKVPKADPSP